MTIALISGGFDPVHVGHLKMIQAAARMGFQIHIILNSDAWLKRKKGYVFMNWEDRCFIMSSIEGVYKVHPVNDGDDTVCAALTSFDAVHHIRQTHIVFIKGGDRTMDNTPERALCEKLGIDVLYGVGGGKYDSSQDLVRKAVFTMCGVDFSTQTKDR